MDDTPCKRNGQLQCNDGLADKEHRPATFVSPAASVEGVSQTARGIMLLFSRVLIIKFGNFRKYAPCRRDKGRAECGDSQAQAQAYI
jgi:hypothetical protein